MADPAERLRELLEHATDVGDPDAALRALTTLREELEAFERVQVARALDAGSSYGAVARALGISRQAAHRRYRDLAGVSLDDPRGAASERIVVTSEARAAVQLAREEAARLGATVVGSEHLVIGLLRLETRASDALRGEGISLDGPRTAAQPTLVDVRPPPRERREEAGELSDYARATFERSLHVALARGDRHLGADHLLLAALADAQGGAARTLAELGVDPAAIRGRIAP